MRACTICSHPDRAAIDRSITSGIPPLRELATTTGLKKTAILRHKVAHLEKAAANGDASDGAITRTDAHAVARQIQVLCADARRLARKAKKKGDYRGAIMALSARGQQLERLMKAMLAAEQPQARAAEAGSRPVNLGMTADWTPDDWADSIIRTMPEVAEVVKRKLLAV